MVKPCNLGLDSKYALQKMHSYGVLLDVLQYVGESNIATECLFRPRVNPALTLRTRTRLILLFDAS